MKLLFTTLLFCCTSTLFSQTYMLGGLQFTSAYGSVTSGGVLLSDSVTIGFDAITPRSLLFVKGRVTFDSSKSKDLFYLNGPFSLYAKVGSGSARLLWYFPGSGIVPVSINALTTTGFVLTSPGDTLPVGGIPFRVSSVALTNKPVSVINNSIISLSGQLEFPGTNGALVYKMEGQQKVVADETGWSAPDFTGSYTGTFKLMGSRFMATSSLFNYESSLKRFRFNDSLTMIFEGGSIPLVPVGSSGLDFVNGIPHWTSSYSICDSFYLGTEFQSDTPIPIYSQLIIPKKLYLKFNPVDSSFAMGGTLVIASAQNISQTDPISLLFGDTIHPFTSIRQGGSLSDFDTSVSIPAITFQGAVFNFSGGVRIAMSHYHRSSSGMDLYGSGTMHFPNDSLSLSFNGSGDISLYPSIQPEQSGFTFDPDFQQLYPYTFTLEGVTFGWFFDKSQNYAMNCSSGENGIMVQYGTGGLFWKLGDAWQPYTDYSIPLTYNGRRKTPFVAKLTNAPYTLEQMHLNIDSGTLGYNALEQRTSVSGTATIKYGNQTFTATLGDASHTGILLNANNTGIDELDIAITGSFSVDDWSFQAKALTLQYDKQTDQFKLFGSVTFQMEDNSLTGDLGTESSPGMWLDNGNIKELNIGINSDIRMSDLEFKTNELGLLYTRNNTDEKFVIHGTAQVKELWSIQATLGDPNTPGTGLEILMNSGKAKVKLDDLEIMANNVNLEGITFKEVDVRFSDNNNDYSVAATVKSVFPAGFEIDGDIGFDESGGTVIFDSIKLSYTALGNNEGIEIPGTGVAIVSMSGGINRIFLDNSETYQFEGSIGLDFGGQFSIGSQTVQMLHIEGDVLIDKDHLHMVDQMGVAAYLKSGSWNSLLGEGIVTLDLNWSTGVYSINGTIDFPSDEQYVTMKGGALYKTTGLMDAELSVGLRIPHSIPLIGGDHIGSVSGAVRYNKQDLNNSWAAGWLRISYLFGHTTVGIKYTFGPKKVSTIGSGTVNNIYSTINRDLGKNGFGKSTPYFTSTTKLELDGQSHTCFVHVTPTIPVDTTNLVISILGPDGSYPNIRFIVRKDSTSFAEAGTISGLGKYYNSNLIPDFVTYIVRNSGDSTDNLPPGEYTVSMTLQQDMPDSFVFDAEAIQSYLSPTCTITNQGQTQPIQPDSATLEIATELYLTNDTLQPQLLVYYDQNNSGYDGILFGTYPIQPGKTNIINIAPFADSLVYAYDTLIVDTNTIITRKKHAIFPVEQSVYFYAVVEDGINLPAKSDYTNVYEFITNPTLGVSVDAAFKPGQLIVSDSVHLFPSVNFTGKDPSHYTFTLYYDTDSAGYNGVPVKGMTDIVCTGLPDDFWFYPHFENISRQVPFFFYAIVQDTITGNQYKSAFTEGYIFGPNVMATVTYNDAASTPARRINIVLDENGNGKYEQQESMITTDNYGRYNCDAPPGTWLSVFLVLPDTLKQVNSTDQMQQLVFIDDSGVPLQTPDFRINYPGIRGKIKTAGGAPFAMKIYADLNNDGVFNPGTESTTTSSPVDGSFVLMNVFGSNIHIRSTGTDSQGHVYPSFTADNPVVNFDDRSIQIINLTLTK
jgi:hypothetical protein